MLKYFIVFGIFCGGLAGAAEKSLSSTVSELKRFYPHKEITISRTATFTFVECLKCYQDKTNVTIKIANSNGCSEDESLCNFDDSGGLSGGGVGNDPKK